MGETDFSTIFISTYVVVLRIESVTKIVGLILCPCPASILFFYSLLQHLGIRFVESSVQEDCKPENSYEFTSDSTIIKNVAKIVL